MGFDHIVNYYVVKKIFVDKEWQEMIPYLGYDKPAFGTKRQAHDSQGREYIYTPHWDGPGSWKRNDGLVFFTRFYKPARDIYGNWL